MYRTDSVSYCKKKKRFSLVLSEMLAHEGLDDVKYIKSERMRPCELSLSLSLCAGVYLVLQEFETPAKKCNVVLNYAQTFYKSYVNCTSLIYFIQNKPKTQRRHV